MNFFSEGYYLKCNFPIDPHARLLIGRLDGLYVGLSVRSVIVLKKGRKVTLPMLLSEQYFHYTIKVFCENVEIYFKGSFLKIFWQ